METTLSSAQERYLEAVYRLREEKGMARVRDLAAALEVHKSTVTGALHALAERDLVDYEPYEPPSLTPEGEAIARRLAARHRLIGCFLHHVLDVDRETADRNACRLEHAVDQEVLEGFVCFLAFMQNCTSGDRDWLADFRRFERERWEEKSCEEWIRECLRRADEYNKA